MINHIRLTKDKTLFICLCFDLCYRDFITIIYSAAYLSNVFLRLDSVDSVL